jgi:hypothetical protein
MEDLSIRIKEFLSDIDKVRSASGALFDPTLLKRYATALDEVSSIQKEYESSLQRALAAKELLRLRSQSPYEITSDTEVARDYAKYQERLTLLNDYNTQYVQAMISAGATQAEIEAKYSELSTSYAKAAFDAKLNYAGQTFGALSNFWQNLYTLSGSKSEAMFELMKGFAVAEATVQGYRAAVGAYAFGAQIGGPALGAAFAATALASTGAQIANILSTDSGSTTAISTTGEAITSTYEGGSIEAYPTSEDTPTQDITIHIYNPLSSQNWAEIVENDIIPALNDAGDRNINITIASD